MYWLSEIVEIHRTKAPGCNEMTIESKCSCSGSRYHILQHSLISEKNALEKKKVRQPCIALYCPACPEGDRLKYEIAVHSRLSSPTFSRRFKGCVAVHDGRGGLLLLRRGRSAALPARKVGGHEVVVRFRIAGRS